MPRRDWNNNAAHSQKPRHKRMHSAAKGKGHDRKMKAVKRGNPDLCLVCGHKGNIRRRKRDETEQDG
jgi:hypothetical protein